MPHRQFCFTEVGRLNRGDLEVAARNPISFNGLLRCRDREHLLVGLLIPSFDFAVLATWEQDTFLCRMPIQISDLLCCVKWVVLDRLERVSDIPYMDGAIWVACSELVAIFGVAHDVFNLLLVGAEIVQSLISAHVPHEYLAVGRAAKKYFWVKVTPCQWGPIGVRFKFTDRLAHGFRILQIPQVDITGRRTRQIQVLIAVMRIPFHVKNTILKRLSRPSLDPCHFIDLGVSVALFWYLENAVLFAATNR